MHDTTAIRGEGIDQLFQQYPEVQVLLDDGYLGLRRDHSGKAQTPPRKPNKLAAPEVHEAWEARHEHSSRRIPVEHALADHKRGKQLTRWAHRRDAFAQTYLAVADLVSDRTVTA
jgi:hypothetical protein